jgi:hypothetical protein
VIAVFLNNKLISCDTILPVAMEAHQRTGRRALFLTTDAETYDGIRQNVVLWDAIQRIGRLLLIGRRRRTPATWLVHRFSVTLLLAWLTVLALAGRLDVFHFRALNGWPLRWLFLVNRNRTYLCESDSFGEPKLMGDVRGVAYARTERRHPPAAGAVIAFHPEFMPYNAPDMAGCPRYVFGPTRLRKVWLDYVRDRADADFAAAFAGAGLADSAEIGAYMLGFFGPIPYLENGGDGVMKTLFEETLDILEECCAELPIFLKPHIFTDMRVVREALSKRPGLKAVVSYLHPTVLATRARFCLTNVYSTTQADAHSLGVPTIEYTAYSADALKVTGNGSMRPDMIDHFINRDPGRLRDCLRGLGGAARRPLPEGMVEDASGLLGRVVGATA